MTSQLARGGVSELPPTRTERDVVLLEHTGGVGLGVRADCEGGHSVYVSQSMYTVNGMSTAIGFDAKKIKTNCAVVFSGERVGRVVDASQLYTDWNVEVGLDRRQGHRVEHHTLQVARKLSGARKVDELQRVKGFGV